MLAIERKNEILATLQKEQSVLVSELSQKYEVTEETIRRDLDKLEKEGFVKKTYGGAVLNQNMNVDLPLKIRQKTNIKEKQAIADVMVNLIGDGESIMLDSSSTSLMIAGKIKQRKQLTVITNSVEILLELANAKSVHVISTGGALRDSSLSLGGKNAERTLKNFFVDKAILSCKGFDMEKGATDSNELEAEIKGTMRECAKTVIWVVDSSKFDKVAFARIDGVQKGDIVVTNSGVSDRWRQYFEKKGATLYEGVVSDEIK